MQCTRARQLNACVRREGARSHPIPFGQGVVPRWERSRTALALQSRGVQYARSKVGDREFLSRFRQGSNGEVQ